MRTSRWILPIALVVLILSAVAQTNVQLQRRQRAANEFHDGVLLLHVNPTLDVILDGFHQDPYFYYFTGLENTIGAILVIDGKTGESWLFLPSNQPYSKRGLQPDVLPGAETAKRLGIEHVVDWAELESFLASRAAVSANLFYVADTSKRPELPDNLLNSKALEAPAWLQMILQRWPALSATEVSRRVDGLMEVQSVDEIAALRRAAKATVAAYLAGMRAIRPNVSQRAVEVAVIDTCWNEGAHGGAFWPWAMAGENAVFPRPFFSEARYDHLNRAML